MAIAGEPPRCADITKLNYDFACRLVRLFELMKRQGYDPYLYETYRTRERQKWLYGLGRTHHRGLKPVTWTLNSKHCEGKAADIISRRKLWNDPRFFEALKKNAEAVGLRTIDKEGCHVEL